MDTLYFALYLLIGIPWSYVGWVRFCEIQKKKYIRLWDQWTDDNPYLGVSDWVKTATHQKYGQRPTFSRYFCLCFWFWVAWPGLLVLSVVILIAKLFDIAAQKEWEGLP